jgi:hypothetical protein
LRIFRYRFCISVILYRCCGVIHNASARGIRPKAPEKLAKPVAGFSFAFPIWRGVNWSLLLFPRIQKEHENHA